MSSAGSWDAIAIEGLEVECVIGLYEQERDRPQQVVVNATLTVDVERAAIADQLIGTVDYEWITTQIAFILKLGRFRLLETAASSICRALLLAPVDGESRGPIGAIELSLSKPSALGGRGVPTLRMRRAASDIEVWQRVKPFGVVDVIHETTDVGLYRLQILPGARIGLHQHRQMQEAELVLSSGLYCQGSPAAVGAVLQWPFGFAHCYDNPTACTQSLLRVDHSPLAEADDTPCEGDIRAANARLVWDL
jgi:dihydroneopterin aldolase